MGELVVSGLDVTLQQLSMPLPPAPHAPWATPQEVEFEDEVLIDDGYDSEEEDADYGGSGGDDGSPGRSSQQAGSSAEEGEEDEEGSEQQSGSQSLAEDGDGE